MKLKNRVEVLKQVAFVMEEHKIEYGIGASMMLYCYGAQVSPEDIDIVIDPKDFEKVNELFLTLGQGGRVIDNHPSFLTTYFGKYLIREVEIDLIAGFNILHEKGLYQYPFSPVYNKTFWLEEQAIKLLPLVDWLVLYDLMERPKKVNMVKDLLKQQAYEEHVLKRHLRQPLPEKVKDHLSLL